MTRVMKIICFIVGLGFSILSLSSKAQSVITFQDAVKIALKNSATLNQQKNNLTFSQVQRTAGIAGLAPTVSVNATALQVNGNFFNQNEGKVVNGLFDQVSGSVNANLNLFSGFSQLNRVRQFNSLLEAQSYYVNRTTQDIISTVSSQYLQVLLDVELLRIANENLAAMNKQLEQVTEQVKLGAKSPVDEYNQDSQAKAAELRALQAEINLISDKALLTQTLLLDPLEQFDIAKPTWDINAIGANKNELPALVESALKSRGDFLRASENEEAAKYSMRSYRGNMMPSLYAFWTLNSSYNYLHGDVNAPFEQQFKTDNKRQTYGLQLSIPIFGGQQNWQNRANFVQQKVAYSNNQIIRKNVEVQVKTDVIRAYQNFELYKRTYAVSKAQLASAEVAFNLETERYNLGVTNYVDYIQANRIFVQAQTDMASAEYRFLFQKILLDYAVGTLKPEDIEQ
jgi:outer membrane protein